MHGIFYNYQLQGSLYLHLTTNNNSFLNSVACVSLINPFSNCNFKHTANSTEYHCLYYAFIYPWCKYWIVRGLGTLPAYKLLINEVNQLVRQAGSALKPLMIQYLHRWSIPFLFLDEIGARLVYHSAVGARTATDRVRSNTAATDRRSIISTRHISAYHYWIFLYFRKLCAYNCLAMQFE